MRDISYRTWIARSLARALLADADQPGATRLAALQARAVATLGEHPAWLAAVITPLATLPTIHWQMMDLDALTERILNPPRPHHAPHRAVPPLLMARTTTPSTRKAVSVLAAAPFRIFAA